MTEAENQDEVRSSEHETVVCLFYRQTKVLGSLGLIAINSILALGEGSFLRPRKHGNYVCDCRCGEIVSALDTSKPPPVYQPSDLSQNVSSFVPLSDVSSGEHTQQSSTAASGTAGFIPGVSASGNAFNNAHQVDPRYNNYSNVNAPSNHHHQQGGWRSSQPAVGIKSLFYHKSHSEPSLYGGVSAAGTTQ